MTRRHLLFLSLISVFVISAARIPRAADPTFKQIDAMVRSLSEITGLQELRPIPYGRMNKRQLHKFLTHRIHKTVRPDEIRADELALKMFGLVPQGFNLKNSTVDLLTEQAAAFYDYDEKRLFLLGDSAVSSEVMTLAHELSHGLADQHFNLSKYMDDEELQDDQSLARSAVVEGQASWLMIAYEMKQDGRPPEPTSEALNQLVNSSGDSINDYPVLKSSPLYIQQSLLFPYTDGTLFFDAVYRREGKAAFARVFTDPPVDSAQILHPDRYFQHLQPSDPAIPDLKELKKADVLNDGSLGEFDHRILLQQFIDQATGQHLAAHLAGSNFRIVGVGGDTHPVLVYVSDWNSEQRAREYFTDYDTVLHKKWKSCDETVLRPNLHEGTGDNGYFVVALSGRVVTSVEGLSGAGLMHSVERELTPPAGAPSPQIH